MKDEHDNRNNSELTDHDKKVLGDRKANLRQDHGDDNILKNRIKPVDFAGKDLDIPGREFQYKHKSTKLNSEENKHFSLGSEHNEELEQSDNSI